MAISCHVPPVPFSCNFHSTFSMPFASSILPFTVISEVSSISPSLIFENSTTGAVASTTTTRDITVDRSVSEAAVNVYVYSPSSSCFIGITYVPSSSGLIVSTFELTSFPVVVIPL